MALVASFRYFSPNSIPYFMHYSAAFLDSKQLFICAADCADFYCKFL